MVWMPHSIGIQSQHRFGALYPWRSPGALDCAVQIHPDGGFMQCHCLSGRVSAKPELINYLGPEITV